MDEGARSADIVVLLTRTARTTSRRSPGWRSGSSLLDGLGWALLVNS